MGVRGERDLDRTALGTITLLLDTYPDYDQKNSLK
jgi:hypothetical protein